MFTGLIETIGTVTDCHLEPDGVSLWTTIAAPFCRDISLGESIAVNGTCLTVVERTSDTFSAQVSPTTLQITTLSDLKPEMAVNLERSVTPTTRLGGHWVLGHVDTRGTVESVVEDGDTHQVTVTYAEDYDPWVLPQGSITLDGVSLTVVHRQVGNLQVTLIPHTFTHTILQFWHVGHKINMEFDVLGKYVEHLTRPYLLAKGGIHHA